MLSMARALHTSRFGLCHTRTYHGEMAKTMEAPAATTGTDLVARKYDMYSMFSIDCHDIVLLRVVGGAGLSCSLLLWEGFA